ncbi:fumarylacetoacetate hydrolase family protein [Fulvivirgaceae bacterium PWU4]|uniref:Fumarylacetoacetate hydrolase family protein n=1 Tax=Chryseosolibacter histidini TaxID=2782349 RepID=A0AAP2DL37_9BACT|nr:fumarylacetoacetate hydrolase family protein [Chryseosolibacter histidini]MBT1698340.1 fumarylacetoacetate hydrolase family protein [Chryseosolibacter histidini]
MKLYKTKTGAVIEKDNAFYVVKNADWDTFLNDDALFEKLTKTINGMSPVADAASLLKQELQAPIQSQEVWASGVTYYRSKVGRQEESKESGGGDFYAKVYEAERPEIFFKATASRTVGHGGKVRIRRDSTWNVPEPELTLVVTSSGKIVGYTIGNDMSSRSIEGENPLYLPQAKTYDGSAALGPCIYVTEKPLPEDTRIEITISRKGKPVFNGDVTINQIKRKFKDLVSFLYRECSFPHGSFLMTGTGIVPSSDFTLHEGDEMSITIGPIGTLVNTVATNV